jgi:hypothetical protein
MKPARANRYRKVATKTKYNTLKIDDTVFDGWGS